MVEFFDYNCGYCKRALTDMMDLMKADPEAARSCSRNSRCSAKARRRPRRSRSPCGCRTRPAARNISSSTRSCSTAAARSTRRARWRSPRRSASTWRGSRRTWRATRSRPRSQESFKIAEAIGLNGTPSYVIGTDVVIGAVGVQRAAGEGQPRPLRQGDVLSPSVIAASRSAKPAGIAAPALPCRRTSVSTQWGHRLTASPLRMRSL